MKRDPRDSEMDSYFKLINTYKHKGWDVIVEKSVNYSCGDRRLYYMATNIQYSLLI